ncbi:ribosome biogenesis protein 15 [[Candida] jaroonii]|uniref:Ribosome biogenesis protein 15 n=1 Tax=[Candida] jaroonii TaxID=467808 RepID=A0ACA9YBZ0_9ASCO|nr:ribosome biogenesis protein 15 [[Candida] jaroonii]
MAKVVKSKGKSVPAKGKTTKPVKEPVQDKQESELDKDEIVLSEESDSESEEIEESDVELSDEESENDEESSEEDVEIKGLEETNKHVVIKPSKKVEVTKNKDKKGVIYLGRIPNGFYEEEMQKYFKQFGNITRLKLSRNKKTGKSKHYGFIEFENFQVAKIASETMNNYLIFGHLLKCYLVEDTSKYDLIFSNNKFKIIPWKSISKFRNDKPKELKHLQKLDKAFKGKNLKRAEILKKKGINTDYLN